jgi:hypothetical protein
MASSGDKFYAHFKVNLSSIQNDNDNNIFRLLNAADAVWLTNIRVVTNSDGSIKQWNMACAGGTEAWTTSPAIATATDYDIWTEYEKGTGSNAICRAYINTSSTKPAVTLQATNGTATTQAKSLYFGDGSTTHGFTLYPVKVSQSTPIGSNP